MNAKRINLGKSYIFPLVLGSQFGYAIYLGKRVDYFVNYAMELTHYFIYGKVDQKTGKVEGIPKGISSKPTAYRIENFNQKVNNWFGKIPYLHKQGYRIKNCKEQEAVIKANKYLIKQQNRLGKHLVRGEIDKYNKLFETLMFQSKLYLLVMFVRKAKDYSTSHSTGYSWKILKKTRKLLRTRSTKLEFRRVFLEELNPDGSHKKYRGLGVPKIHWRVIAGMLEQYLVNIHLRNWPENQYACMPKRGVADVWIRILSEYKNYKTIVGIDLAKFFDSINLAATDSILRKNGVSTTIADLLNGINRRRAKIAQGSEQMEEERIKTLYAETSGPTPLKAVHAEEYVKWPPKKSKTSIVTTRTKYITDIGLSGAKFFRNLWMAERYK
jgi:hypothetical protein